MGHFIIDRKSCSQEAGYSLIGVALFIVVLGIFVSGGITLKQQYDWSKRQEITVANMALVKDALGRYQTQYGRLPCPASLGDAPDNANFGRERDCVGAAVAANTFRDQGRGGRNIRYGAVPVRTLGLPDSALVDGWNHRLVYAVTEYYAGPSNTINPDFDFGAISIVDANGTNTTNVGGNVIYTVMAPGADERGAYTMAGTLIDPCVGTNCTAGDGTLQLSIFRQYNTQTSASNSDFTATMTYAASSASYEWREGDWSACSCCTHTQDRTAGCYQVGENTQVADNLCAESMKPALNQKCAAYCWTATPWETQASCGQTTQKRIVSCKQNDGTTVPNSLCQGAKLADSRPWNAGDCCGGGGGGSGGGDDTSFGYDRSGNATTTFRNEQTGSMQTESGHNYGRSCSGGSLMSDCGGGSSCTVGSGADRDKYAISAPKFYVDTGLDGKEDKVGLNDDLCQTNYAATTPSRNPDNGTDREREPEQKSTSKSKSDSKESSSKKIYVDTDGDGKSDLEVKEGQMVSKNGKTYNYGQYVNGADTCTGYGGGCSAGMGSTVGKNMAMVDSNPTSKSKSSSSSSSSSGKTSSLSSGSYKNSKGETIKVDSKGNATNTSTGKTYPSGTYTATVKK